MAELQGKLVVEIGSYWHAGAGQGDRYRADAVVMKEHGLPVLPGRHLGGLIAHEVRLLEAIAAVSSGALAGLCGGGQRHDRPSRFESTLGTFSVDSARLPAPWPAWVRGLEPAEQARQTAPFYRTLGSTRLVDGVAKDETLRKIEVAVPLTLEASVSLWAPQWKAALEAAVSMVQFVGAMRTRGLGRARLRLEWMTV